MGFPVWKLPAAERLAVLDLVPAVRAQLREVSNGFAPGSADDLRAHVEAMTGRRDAAEAAVLAWREARVEAGMPAG